MSKGGGSTQTSTTTIPQWMQDAAKQNLARANQVADIGYVPNYGLDVAAFSPMQQQAMQASGMAGQAFGLAPQGFNATAGIPTPVTNSLGFTGYSSGNMFDQALNEFAQRRPGQFTAMSNQFVDPITGAASLPTALDTLYNPASTASQIQGLMGTDPRTGDDPTANLPEMNSLDRYLSARNYMYDMDSGQRSDLSKALGTVSLGGYGLNQLNQNYIDRYEKDNMWRSAGSLYGAGDGKLSTNDPEMAKRLGITYVPPAPAPVTWSAPATWSGGTTSGGDLYSGQDWGSASDWSNSGTGFTSDPFA